MLEHKQVTHIFELETSFQGCTSAELDSGTKQLRSFTFMLQWELEITKRHLAFLPQNLQNIKPLNCVNYWLKLIASVNQQWRFLQYELHSILIETSEYCLFNIKTVKDKKKSSVWTAKRFEMDLLQL